MFADEVDGEALGEQFQREPVSVQRSIVWILNSKQATGNQWITGFAEMVPKLESVIVRGSEYRSQCSVGSMRLIEV